VRKIVKTTCHLSLAVVLVCQATTFAQEVLFSGPQPGETLPALTVVDAQVSPGVSAGSEKPQPYDLVARMDGKSSIYVFVHDLLRNKSDEPSLGLSYMLSHYAASREDTGLVCRVVYLTDDVAALNAFLTKIRRALPKKKTPLTICTQGLEGPGAWGLNNNLRMTVVIANDNVVTASFAIQQPSVAVDAERILAELVKVIGGTPPKLRDLDFPYYIAKPDDAKPQP
jgi:hypothetical protein